MAWLKEEIAKRKAATNRFATDDLGRNVKSETSNLESKTTSKADEAQTIQSSVGES